MLARAPEQVGDRWTPLVVRDLIAGAKRFTDPMNRLGGITPRPSQRLRELEDAGIIEVERTPGRPEVADGRYGGEAPTSAATVPYPLDGQAPLCVDVDGSRRDSTSSLSRALVLGNRSVYSGSGETDRFPKEYP